MHKDTLDCEGSLQIILKYDSLCYTKHSRQDKYTGRYRSSHLICKSFIIKHKILGLIHLICDIFLHFCTTASHNKTLLLMPCGANT